MEPTFFETPAELRKWFVANYADASELWVGYYKKDSGKASITWPESVDEALCFGWIDGVRYSVDEISYKIRFSPRQEGQQLECSKYPPGSGINRRRVDAACWSGSL